MTPVPVLSEPPRPWAALCAVLTRIDGWGPLAWREALGAWRIGRGRSVVLAVADPDADDPLRVRLTLLIDGGLPGGDAACDWALRRFAAAVERLPLRVETLRPGAAVRATTAATREGGALATMAKPFQWGAGGVVGKPP